MKTIAVAWNGTTLNDKVKLLSVTELGYYEDVLYQPLSEGNNYLNTGITKLPMDICWVRTLATNNSSYVFVHDRGTIQISGSVMTYYDTRGHFLPTIRLG